MKYVPDEKTAKLIMLYVFQEMEYPLTDDSIVEICTSRNTWVKYIDYKRFLEQLLATRLLSKIGTSNVECMYMITENGSKCLTNFMKTIPNSVQEEIKSYAKENKLKTKLMQENTFEAHKQDNGTYDFILKIKNVGFDSNLLEMKLSVPSEENAKFLEQNWALKAGSIYQYIYNKIINYEAKDNEDKI